MQDSNARVSRPVMNAVITQGLVRRGAAAPAECANALAVLQDSMIAVLRAQLQQLQAARVEQHQAAATAASVAYATMRPAA